MKVAVDLHIHTALSPCADNDMTPNNIVNMAYLKGLDVIAITDHNCVENYEAVASCAKEKGIIAVPGMELETREEVHLVCLFPNQEAALKMQKFVFRALPELENRTDIFGQQLVMDQEDNVTGEIKRLLVTAADIGIDEAFAKVEELNGVVIPAHVDRSSNSVISNLGIIPDYLDINYIEISNMCNYEELKKKYLSIGEYIYIRSSDAHYLWDILERECFIEVMDLSIAGLIETLKIKGRAK